MHILNTRVKVIGVLLGVLAVLGFLTYSFISPYGIFSGLSNDLKNIEPPIEAAYTDLDGNAVLLSSMKGKPLIVNSWATWMPFSKDELALLNDVKKQYGDSIEILAINRMEDKEFIKSFLSTYAIERTITLLTDPTDNFYKAIQGYAMPETVFYRDDGTLMMHKRGVLTRDELVGYIKLILD